MDDHAPGSAPTPPMGGSALIETGDPALPLRGVLTLPSGVALQELVGEQGGHLRVISRALGVKVGQRGDQISVQGERAAVLLAQRVIGELYEVAAEGNALTAGDVDQACRLMREDKGLRIADLYREALQLGVGRKRLSPRSARQREYLHAIRSKELVFGIGPAGTGKTFLAMAMALHALMEGRVKRLVLSRPAVEAGEKLGFLPGDLTEKVNPYLRPLYDALHDLLGFEKAERLMKQGVVEVAPLAFMRGRTLSEAFVILDEAQNTTPEQMKMFLTRIGPGSRVVVTGDVTQIDLPNGTRSGLVHAMRVLDGLEEVRMIHFNDVDVVRHPLVATIVRAYARDEARSAEARGPRRPRGPVPPAAAPPAGAQGDEDAPPHG
jgi:phosphate starvation-inducible PhoH-like protein